ncbi:uncharacterized protein TRIVIDRAFT_138208, partial [Trichoderma virens Gv29-8]
SVTSAVARGHIDTLQLLLSHGANVESIGMFEDRTALHIAADNGNEAIAKILLDYNADPNAQSVEWGTPLGIASYSDNEAIVKLLIEYGAKVNTISASEHGTALCAAASNGSHSASICYLVEKAGDDIHAVGGFYGTALQAASSRGYLYTVALLLHNGASPNEEGGRCGTALQAAAYHGYLDVVNLLLGKGAKVNQRGGLYDTALQAAAFQGHTEVVELLLKHGANVHLQG